MAEAFGLEMHDLPDGAIPIGVITCIKYIDEDGDVAWAIRTSRDINMMEGVGMADLLYRKAIEDAMDCWGPSDG